MEVYVPSYRGHAGKWIYAGFKAAWNKLGYNISARRGTHIRSALEAGVVYPKIEDAADAIIMTTDDCIVREALEIINKSHKQMVNW